MRAPQTLVQAAFNRMNARLGSSLADAAASLAVLAQDAPERLRQEWQLFREEVELEAERLERGEPSAAEAVADEPLVDHAAAPVPADPQEQIDQLRARVAQLVRRFEEQA